MTTRCGQVFSTGLAKPPKTGGMPRDGTYRDKGWNKKLLSGPCYVMLCILSVAPKSSEICIYIYIIYHHLDLIIYGIQWLSSNIGLIIVFLSNPCHPSRGGVFPWFPSVAPPTARIKDICPCWKKRLRGPLKVLSRQDLFNAVEFFVGNKSGEQTIDFAMLQRVHSGIIILNDESCSWFSGKTQSYIHSSKSYKTPRRL